MNPIYLILFMPIAGTIADQNHYFGVCIDYFNDENGYDQSETEKIQGLEPGEVLCIDPWQTVKRLF